MKSSFMDLIPVTCYWHESVTVSWGLHHLHALKHTWIRRGCAAEILHRYSTVRRRTILRWCRYVTLLRRTLLPYLTCQLCRQVNVGRFAPAKFTGFRRFWSTLFDLCNGCVTIVISFLVRLLIVVMSVVVQLQAMLFRRSSLLTWWNSSQFVVRRLKLPLLALAARQPNQVFFIFCYPVITKGHHMKVIIF